MRFILTALLLCCLSLGAQAKNDAFPKLAEINRCWLEQKDLPRHIPMPGAALDDQAWIQYHLELVEQTLRSRSVAGLNPQQRANRAASLNDLNAYRHAGRFPINDQSNTRTPIFIDRQDNFCAVGYLLKASGCEAVSRKIAANTNLAYVRQMRYPELAEWADLHGFTVDELAWIQPTYRPIYNAGTVGKGTNGEVRALHADNAADKLYVGGDFSNVDSALGVSYIAYVTEEGGRFTWHQMNGGTPPAGPVNAILGFGGKVFAGCSAANGSGSSASYWDGSSWHPAGTTTGRMLDLKEMGGGLYAAGDFDDANVPYNFAKWNGSYWVSIPGLWGTVNTIYALDTTLVLGGSFSYQGQALNVIQWSESGSFKPFANGLANEVRDFELFNDTLYAVCRQTSATDTLSLLVHLENGRWTPPHNSYFAETFKPVAGSKSFNTLFRDGDKLFLGGSFLYDALVGYYSQNNMSLRADMMLSYGEWTTLDGTVNTITRFKDYLIQGGSFRTDAGAPWMPATLNLNHITASHQAPTYVPGTPAAAVFGVYPNPVRSGGRLRLTSGYSAGTFRILDLSGRKVSSGTIRSQAEEIRLPELAPGMYLLQLEDRGGSPLTGKFSVQ